MEHKHTHALWNRLKPESAYTTRARPRRPPKSKTSPYSPIATRGATAGLLKRVQTHPRQHLAWQDMAAVHDAEAFASHLSLPLTAFVTVTWRWPTLSSTRFNGELAEDWNEWHRRFVKAMTIWLQRHQIPVAFLYVRERCVGRGAHTHFMVHLPNRPAARWCMLKSGLTGHLTNLCRRQWGMCGTAVDVSGDGFKTAGMAHQSQRLGLLAYLSKALNPDELVYTGTGVVRLPAFLGIVSEDQASVPVKRVGWSQNIGEKARKQAGWRDTDDLLRLAEMVRGNRRVAGASSAA